MISILPSQGPDQPGFLVGVNLNEGLGVSASILSVEVQWRPWTPSPVLCLSDKCDVNL